MIARPRIGGAQKKGRGSPPRSRWTNVLFRPRAPANQRTNAAPEAEGAKPAPQPRSAAIGPGYLVLLLLVLGAVASAFVFHLHVRFDGIELGYATSAARARQSHLVLERQELRLELASLKSPARVQAEARERLGMDVPDHDRIIVIGDPKKPAAVSGGAL
jgi:cell division protein FtsL